MLRYSHAHLFLTELPFQINVAELPFVPEILSDLAFVSGFVDPKNLTYPFRPTSRDDLSVPPQSEFTETDPVPEEKPPTEQPNKE